MQAPFDEQDDEISQRITRILVVDDNDASRALLERRVMGLGYQVETADSGPRALAYLNSGRHYDLILLDILMPDMSGIEVLGRIRETFPAMQLPVIMVSALDESSSIAEALNKGANDYITKPVDVIVARARIQTHLRLKQAEDAMRRMDAMTGLGNRLYFMERLRDAWNRSQAESLSTFTLLVFGLDRYYMITESLGPDASEELAQQIAGRIKRKIRQSDTAARLGENEFAVLIEAASDSAPVLAMGDFLQGGLQGAFEIRGQEITGSASAGVACFSERYERCEELLRDAGIARNRAKDLGGNRLVIFENEMHSSSARLLQMEVELRRALQQKELEVYYQPIISVASGKVSGFEALVRWAHPEHGVVGPGEFIPLAEATGLIVPLGEYVLASVCAQLTRWQGTVMGDLFVAVNVSARQFADQDSIDRIKSIISENYEIVPRLKMELTESAVMDDVEHSTRTLRHFNELGIGISIDDFGTGYSSLALLKSLPISTLKIDRSFVQDLNTNNDDQAIIAAILALSRQLKLKVVAEGVETEFQRDFLSKAECDEFQGFYFSPPLALPDLEALLHNGGASGMKALGRSASGDATSVSA